MNGLSDNKNHRTTRPRAQCPFLEHLSTSINTPPAQLMYAMVVVTIVLYSSSRTHEIGHLYVFYPCSTSSYAKT